MGRSKDQFIEATGGNRIDESDPTFRQYKIAALEEKLRSGKVPLAEVDGVVEQIRASKGLPSAEWDYEPND